MAKNETDIGLFVALNYFSHLPLCLSEKIRRCFKSFDNLEKTSDFFRSLAETDYHYCGVRHTPVSSIKYNLQINRQFPPLSSKC